MALDTVGLFISKFLAGAADFAVIQGADTIHVPVIDADDVEKPKLPYVSVRHLSTGIGSAPRHYGQRLAPTAKVDVIAAVSGQVIYQVTQRDIDSVTSITGTVAGVPHTFLPATFATVSTVGYTTQDAVQFTGTPPDPATSFTVTYNHRLYETLKATQFSPTLRLFLHVGTLRAGEQASVASSYLKTRLADLLWQALWARLVVLQGKALDTADAFGNALVLSEPFLLGSIPADRSDTYVRIAVDVRLEFHQRVVVDTHEAIGRIPAVGVPSV